MAGHISKFVSWTNTEDTCLDDKHSNKFINYNGVGT